MEAKLQQQATQQAKETAELQQQAKLSAEQQAKLSAELQQQATLSAEQQAKLSAELQQQATLSAEQQAKLSAELQQQATLSAELQQQATQQAKETALSVVPRVFFAASQIIESICKSKSSLSSVTPPRRRRSHMASSSPVGVGLAKAVGVPLPRLDQVKTVRNMMAHPATRKALDAECAFLTRHLPVLEEMARAGTDPYLKELGGKNVVTAVKVVRELPCLKVIFAFAFFPGK
jgi:multidrug efflux pump subunit AcrA (membrane-fusion protein)